VTVVLTCNNNYPITEDVTTVTPQFISHDDPAVGFVLAVFTSSQQVGCPTQDPVISTSNSAVYAPTDLVVDGVYPNFMVKPVDNTIHLEYPQFYISVTADGNS